MQNLWKLIQYRSFWAKMVLTVVGIPFLIPTLIFLPSPMTAMKLQVYCIIIPIGVGGTLISALVEISYRRCLHRRRTSVIVWPRRRPH